MNQPICAMQEPPLQEVGVDHVSQCHFDAMRPTSYPRGIDGGPGSVE